MLLNKPRSERIMNRLGLDALVATSPYNVMYASNYECVTHWINPGSQVYALLSPSCQPEASLIAPCLELEAIADSGVWMDDIYLVGTFRRNYEHLDALESIGRKSLALQERAQKAETALEALVQAILSRGLSRGRIGVDETGMPPQMWAELQRRLPGAQIVPAGHTWWEVRMVKTPKEIQRLRRSSAIVEEAINTALGLARPGVAEREILREYHRQLVSYDAQPVFSCFGSGARSAYPHILPSDKPLAEGDVLRFDIGCTYRYYFSDTARSVVLGAPNDLQRRVWAAMVEGEEAAIALVRPGADPREIFDAAMAPGLQARLHEFARVHCGHAIGISVYDPPLIMAADPTRSVYLMPGVEEGLEENMVINIETGYYIQGVGGFQVEDTMVVTSGGCELITHNSKELMLGAYLSLR